MKSKLMENKLIDAYQTLSDEQKQKFRDVLEVEFLNEDLDRKQYLDLLASQKYKDFIRQGGETLSHDDVFGKYLK